jgi:hypothetical protein
MKDSLNVQDIEGSRPSKRTFNRNSIHRDTIMNIEDIEGTVSKPQHKTVTLK